MPRPQFTLRALLVALTVACLSGGWAVDRAKRRGVAIDSIVASGGMVDYQGQLWLDVADKPETQPHFWLDLKRVPITIYMADDVRFDPSLGNQVRDARPVALLKISNRAVLESRVKPP
jgi:hypothetical protein